MAVKLGDPVVDPTNPNPTPPPPFDPEAFTARILGEFNKGINALDKKFAALSKSVTPAAPASADPAAPPDPAAPVVDPPPNPKIAPEINAELAALKRQLSQVEAREKKANEDKDAERKSRLDTERATAIRGALNDIPFHTEGLRTLFFRATQSDIRREDDGSFVADSENGVLPMKAYLKDLAERDYAQMLVPKGGGGAGAAAGNASRKSSGPLKLSDITPQKMAGKTPAELQAMLQDIKDGNVT